VLYFAALRDLARTDQEEWLVSESTSVGALLEQLRQRHPSLRFEGVRCAVNEEFVDTEHVLWQGDVLALIPPVSGG